MVQRLISVGAVALALALAGTVIAACYDVPAPDCGFVCGPNNACPDGYSCGSAQRCRRIDAPVTVVCSASDIDAGSRPEAGRPSDASIDSSGSGSGGSSGTGPPPDPGLQLVPP